MTMSPNLSVKSYVKENSFSSHIIITMVNEAEKKVVVYGIKINMEVNKVFPF